MSTAPVICPILVGRDDLLDRIDELIDQARGGHGHALFLAGQAGLGKTRLMWAAIRKAQAAGFAVDGGSVAPQDSTVPLASIHEMAVGMRGNAVFGQLSIDLLAIDGRHDGDPLGARRLIVRSTADRILEAIDRPTLLVFQDLHWTDEMSLEVIGELARHVTERPLLLMADYRPDELPTGTIHREWRARILGQRHAEEARLQPLTLEQTGTATTVILGGELPAPREVVEAVYSRTNGIPLHIEELLAAVEPAARSDGRRILEAHVPDTIGDAVLARMGRLSEDARTVISAGAVIGRCFTPEVLAGVVDRPLADLEGSLQELVDAAFLHPFQYIDDGYFDFRHQLLRDAIYGSLPPSLLRRYHAQAAEFAMQLEGSNVVHASRHYERAGLRPQAFRAAMTAAREASRISARHEAYELYQRAIANMPAGLPAEEQADLYAKLSNAAAAIEMNDDASGAAATARELYRAAGRPLEAAEMLLAMSCKPGRDGAPTDEVRSFADRAMREIMALPETRERELTRVLVMTFQATDRFRDSDLAGARSLAREARQLAESLGDRESVLEFDLLLARIEIVDGRYESGLRDGMRAAREARDAGYEAVGVTGYRNIAVLAARVMDARAAELAIHEGLQYADAIEQSHCRQTMAVTTAALDWAAGRWDAADERARHELVDRGCRTGTVGALDVIGLVAMGRGRLDEARRWLDESLEVGRRVGAPSYLLTPLWGLAEVELQAGAAAAAVERSEEAFRIARSSGEWAMFIPALVSGTRSLIAALRPDEADRWVREAREHLAPWASVAAPALTHAEGLVRLAQGSTSAAREALERAARGWADRGRVWESSWAKVDLAQALIRLNRGADAAAVLADVGAKATTLGSAPLTARIEELVRATRGRGLEQEPWRPLTMREFEVARRVAEGRTNAEIADDLAIAVKTASSHVEHILAKLGVSRRAEIAAWAAKVEERSVQAPVPQPVPSQHAGVTRV
jgi:DNA-binding CsgD family transcriptional regulator/tetratricopeptide (TPR) repeat protein